MRLRVLLSVRAHGQGFITHKEIEKVCDFLTPEATQQLIKEVDSNMDGKINFGEWLEAMTDLDIQKGSGVVSLRNKSKI